MAGGDSSITSWRDYLLFDHLSDVPEQWFHNRQVVVERFCPEIERGLYHLRMFQFLGDRWSCTRLASKEPIIKAESSIHMEPIEPDPVVTGWRDRLGMEYGKARLCHAREHARVARRKQDNRRVNAHCR